jgi:hypothetical protein
VFHVEDAYEDAIEAAVALSRALIGEHAENNLKRVVWPGSTTGEEWRRIERVPADPALKQVGTLQLTLKRSQSVWQIGVAYGETP